MTVPDLRHNRAHLEQVRLEIDASAFVQERGLLVARVVQNTDAVDPVADQTDDIVRRVLLERQIQKLFVLTPFLIIFDKRRNDRRAALCGDQKRLLLSLLVVKILPLELVERQKQPPGTLDELQPVVRRDGTLVRSLKQADADLRFHLLHGSAQSGLRNIQVQRRLVDRACLRHCHNVPQLLHIHPNPSLCPSGLSSVILTGPQFRITILSKNSILHKSRSQKRLCFGCIATMRNWFYHVPPDFLYTCSKGAGLLSVLQIKKKEERIKCQQL